MAPADPGPGKRPLDAATDYLESLINVERRPEPAPVRLGLDPVRRLLARVGDPHAGLSVVHLAGSKGKGSTALMAEAILRAAGERVGTFTSPHLERWTERFRIDGREVDGDALARAVSSLRPHVEALRASGTLTPTFFDVTTAAAFLLFREAGVDRVVLEVGLGGRLDSTNVAQAAVACVTSIELEHTDRLGTTRAAIAREKAGIVKRGRPVVLGALAPDAARVVESRAAELCAPVARLGRDFEVEARRAGVEGLELRLRDGPLAVDVTLPVLGAHQAQNAALALACVRRLRAHEPGALADAARRGLAQVALPGRIELLGRRPWTLVDSAHTAASARALAGVLEALPRRRLCLVLSVSVGKSLAEILDAWLPLASEVIATRAEPVRSLAPDALAARVRESAPGVAVRVVAEPQRAIRAGLETLAPDDLLCVAGSVYLAGIARTVLRAPQADASLVARDWFGRERAAPSPPKAPRGA
ncbi:MAG: bifunctional folylpolyglutamate synthase/dihydrofolate synthase [Deltaproteobacteria bacterium]|nr:MAG: bifunctional folylpolyglutamate synthase/dihydrofolate synthase [Deltaproteobacteria bacterium]